MKDKITKEYLHEEYVVKKRGLKSLSQENNCSIWKIVNKLKKYSITVRDPTRFIDITNKIYGKLIVVERCGKYRKVGGIKWKCLCKCGKIIIVSGQSLKNGNTKSCGKCNSYMEINCNFWRRIIKQAKLRNLDMKITLQFIWNLFIKQNRKCALSGKYLEFAQNNNFDSHGYTTASLDRIDNDKGYLEDNVQWTHKNINLAKRRMTDYEFIKMCDDVANHNRYRYSLKK